MRRFSAFNSFYLTKDRLLNGKKKILKKKGFSLYQYFYPVFLLDFFAFELRGVGTVSFYLFY